MAIKVEVQDPEIIRLGINSGVKFCSLMAVEKLDCEGVVAITTRRPDPVLNLVVHSEIEEKDADEKIKKVIEFYRQYRVAWTWVVDPLTRPTTLPNYLEDNGFAYLEQYPSLYFDLTKPLPQKPLGKLEIREAAPDDPLLEWAQPISIGFPSGDKGVGFREINANLPHGKGTPLRQLMAYYRNQIASAGTLYIGDDAVMIHNIATKTAYRKQGFGTALTLYAMQEAKRLGFKHCFLDSTTLGFNLYRNLGFKVYALSKVYALKIMIRRRT